MDSMIACVCCYDCLEVVEEPKHDSFVMTVRTTCSIFDQSNRLFSFIFHALFELPNSDIDEHNTLFGLKVTKGRANVKKVNWKLRGDMTMLRHVTLI